MMRSLQRKQKGYLLIEAMVAMGVLTTSVLGIFALMSQSIKLTRVIDDQYIGTYLAAEGIELTKNILDARVLPGAPGPWNGGGFDVDNCYAIDITAIDLSSTVGVGCPDAGNVPLGFDNTFYQYGVGVPSPFRRSLHISPIVSGVGAQEGVRVVSTVTWASGEQSISLEDKFYAWH